MESQQYSHQNKTCTTPVNMPVYMGKSHKAPSIDEELLAIPDYKGPVFPRDEFPHWLSNII